MHICTKYAQEIRRTASNSRTPQSTNWQSLALSHSSWASNGFPPIQGHWSLTVNWECTCQNPCAVVLAFDLFIHIYIYTYTYIHRYIYIYLHTYIHVCNCDLNIAVAWYMTLVVVYPDGSEQRILPCSVAAWKIVILNLYGCKGGHWLQVTKITNQTSTYFKQVQFPNWNYRAISMHFDMTFPRASPALPKGPRAILPLHQMHQHPHRPAQMGITPGFWKPQVGISPLQSLQLWSGMVVCNAVYIYISIYLSIYLSIYIYIHLQLLLRFQMSHQIVGKTTTIWLRMHYPPAISRKWTDELMNCRI